MPTENKANVRVRFAPSPTGPFHIGGARTALFNWLFSRQNNGVFVLRIEDTDKERSSPEFEEQIIDSLKWLGINWNEGPDIGGKYGPYRQSERASVYERYILNLLETEKAYYCYCTREELEAQRQSMLAQGIAPKYNGHCRNNTAAKSSGKIPQVIRFKTPETQVEVKDMIRGIISFDASLFGDFAIAKDMQTPLYNLAVVIDDGEMKINYVIRGEDHLPNTPKQILLQRALEFEEPPLYAHVPLILATDKSKLSKRYAEVSLLEYRDKGYLPQALINFIAMLGWHPRDNKEVLTLEELVNEFELKRVQKAGAVFNVEKLEWLNREHMKRLSTENIFEFLAPQLKEREINVPKEMLLKIIEELRGRMKTQNDFFELADLFFTLPEYEAKLLVWNNDDPKTTKSVLKEEIEAIRGIKAVNIATDDIKDAFKKTGLIVADEYKYGTGSTLWPFRVALSGQSASPEPFIVAEILGKKETLRRLAVAIEKFGSLL